jgi:quercetin dioxygenase-like cupin family protein
MILSDLLHGLADLTASEPRAEARATAAALRQGAHQDFPPAPPSALSPEILRAADLPGAHPSARLIHQAHPWLPWADSPLAARQPDALRAIKSVVTLLGPAAPIPSDTLLFGLFYQAPGTHYPLHAHSAAETYTLLSGTAHWQAGDQRLTLSAGGHVHHPPNLPHAMRSGPQGFLAMWRWSGDVSFASYRLLADPLA